MASCSGDRSSGLPGKPPAGKLTRRHECVGRHGFSGTIPLKATEDGAVSRHDLDRLISALEVTFVRMAECLVSPGWRLDGGGSSMSAIHYCVSGSGSLTGNGFPPVRLQPHTLVILPKATPFQLQSDGRPGGGTAHAVDATLQSGSQVITRYVAGHDQPGLIMICGYFQALYAPSLGLFEALETPIIEHFEEADRIDWKLREAIDELVVQEVGTGTMTASLLKLVLIRLLRRSLGTQKAWIEGFALLRDPQVSRAFLEMLSLPGVQHSVHSLSKAAGLSRSAFMERFSEAFGQPPMAVLRKLRMRHSQELLATPLLSIDQVAYAVGYESRSSFSRAFRKTYGTDPTDYRSGRLSAQGA